MILAERFLARPVVGVEQKPKQADIPVVLRKRRERIKSEANWKMFYYQFVRDHAKPNLIWNLKVRRVYVVEQYNNE